VKLWGKSIFFVSLVFYFEMKRGFGGEGGVSFKTVPLKKGGGFLLRRRKR
jgi:hypothetical protein